MWSRTACATKLLPTTCGVRGTDRGAFDRSASRRRPVPLTAGERLALPVDNQLTREHAHVQALCDATLTTADGTIEHGIGILEQLAIGPHPTGLTGILDGYAG